MLTDEIHMAMSWARDEGCLNHPVCKLTALRKAAKRAGANMDETVAVGMVISTYAPSRLLGWG